MPGRRPLLGWGRGSQGTYAALLIALAVGAAVALLPSQLSAAVVAGGIALIGITVRPELGLLLLVPAVPFGSFRQIAVGAMNVGLTEALFVAVIIGWLARLATRPHKRIVLPPLAIPIFSVLAVMLLSTIGAASIQLSVSEIVKWIELAAIYVFVYNELDELWAKAAVVTLLVTGGVAAAQGIHQFLFRVGPEGFVLFERFMRAHGTFGQPNPFAGYLGLALPLAAGMMVAGFTGGRGSVTWRWALLGSLCGALMLCGIIMSWSRGAWLGLAAALVAIAVALLWRPGRARYWLSLAAVLIFCGMLAGGWARVPGFINQRLSDLAPYLSVSDVRGVEITDANYAVLERLAHWQTAWRMWTDHPWLGVGPANYEAVYSQYRLPSWPEPLGHAHNYYLNMAAETGSIGLLLLLLLGVSALIGVWRAIRHSSGWRLGILLGALGMIVHLGVHSLFDNLFVHGMYLQMGLVLGLAGIAARRSTDSSLGQTNDA